VTEPIGESGPQSTIISRSSARYALTILTIVYTFNFIDRQILAILLPAIKAEFQVADWVLGMLHGTSFALFYATLGIPIALLGDRFSRRNLIAIALAIWSAMTALSGMAASIVQLTLARIGVGIGEAGCSPPAHSMLSDYYPPSQRSTAMGIYSLGISLGIMLAYVGGGWVAENIGWRQAFFIVGIPGVILAFVVRFTVKEPVRGSSESRADTADRSRILHVGKFLMRRRSFLHIAIGSGLASFGGYSVASFFPSFLHRTHEMSLSQAGLALGLIIGVAGGLGYAGGGYIADKLGATERRRALNGVAFALVVGWIFSIPVLLTNNLAWCLSLFVVPTIFSNFYLATTIAQTQSLVGLRMRAVASAYLFFILNAIGLGLGPVTTGFLSDMLVPQFGDDSLRYSLLIVGIVVSPWSALHYYLAGRHIDSDLLRADDPL
jgi:predicted MFS family arabinose efflux permease